MMKTVQGWVCAAILFGLGPFGCSMPHGGKPAPNVAQESPYQKIESLAEGKILHVPTGIEISPRQLFDHVGHARIIYVGEVHSNMQHHRVQLEILKALTERFPDQIAVGMEMFQKPSQPVLDLWRKGFLNEKEFMREWYANWTQEYGYYKPILEYIREKNLSLIALNASDSVTKELAQKGWEGLPEEIRKNIPDLDERDPYHRQAMEAVFGSHSHGAEGFERFYRTMVVWDETMAQSIADYLNSPEGNPKKLLVFAGGFHVAHGFGIPRRVFRRLPEPYRIILPHTSIEAIPAERPDLIMDVSPPQLPLYLADFVWSVGYEELEEERVFLGVRIDQASEGVLVKDVLPDSPAARGGIRTGDIVRLFDGEVMKEPFDLSYAVGLRRPGETVTLQILRDGKSVEVQATFGRTPTK